MAVFWYILFVFIIAKCNSSIVRSHYNHFRIVGGENASIADYPYQVSITFFGYHGCGGSIINENFILTAAHCTYDVTAANIAIRVNSSIRDEGGAVYEVEKINVHPDFNSKTFDYDISILKLSTPLILGDGVKPITLASPGTQLDDGIEATATGWGQLGEHLPTSYQLQVVILPIISTETCSQYYPSGYVTENMFCAGYESGGKDTCQGDSGGPLVVAGIQVGITSWGIGCAVADQPGAVTKIPMFIDYVNSIINES